MLTPEQISARRFFIGSSEAAAACGISPYKTPLALWLEKTNRVPRADLSGVERIHFGNVLEPIVAAEYARRNPRPDGTPRSIERNTETVYNGIRAATIDYRIDGVILECKTADAFTRHLWIETIPTDYRIQVEHQTMTTEEPAAVLAVIIGGNEFRQYQCPANDFLRETIDREQRRFFQYLETDTPPPAETMADVILLFPDPEERVDIAPPDLVDAIAAARQAQDQARQYTEQADKLREFIGKRLSQTTRVLDADHHEIATFRRPAGVSIDWEAVAAELAGHVARNTWQQTVRKYSTPRKRTLRIRRPNRPPQTPEIAE